MKLKLLAGLYLVAAIVITSLLATPLAQAAPAAPTGITVEQDDNNARLSWGPQMNNGNVRQDGIAGYKVVWGPTSNPAATTQLTEYRSLQLQPLTNGQTYVATIQTVDFAGNLSAPTAPINFTGDATRVNTLRAVDTGFFDDFNTPAGALDELKWNQAVSKCVDPSMTTSFVNNQFHAHNMVFTGFCDRGQVINRIRPTFDFTGRTGTINFDLDGSQNRAIWYLDFLPASLGPLDITSHVDFFDGDKGHPGNELRISQSDSGVNIGRVDANGNEGTVATTDWNPYPPIDWLGLVTIPNYRRHWEIKVSTTNVAIKVDGQTVLTKDFSANPLPFSKATLQWNMFSYNTPKANLPAAMIHWDNFGFDGPAPTTETHSYRTAQTNSRDYLEASSGNGVVSPTASITIPDSLAGATAQRLMFTIEAGGYQTYNWKQGDKVVINGTSVAMPQITSVDGGNVADFIRPFAEILPVPAGLFHTGSNTVQFVSSYMGVLNIHAEFDFPKGSAPVYTQPNSVYPETAAQTTPMSMDVGPAVIISDIDSTQMWTKPTSVAVRGLATIKLAAYGEIPMVSIGKNNGIAKLQLRVDKQVIKEWDTSAQPVPSNYQTYQLDTTKFTNGNHDIDVVAYSPTGAISTPDYFESFEKPGDYSPFVLAVNNANPATATPTGAPTATATATIAPTATATAAPTATNAPPTATAVPSATPTLAPTDTAAAPTATPTPIVAFTPTPTAVPATATAVPTATAVSTATPTVAPTVSPAGKRVMIHSPKLTTPAAVDAWYNSLIGNTSLVPGRTILDFVPGGLETVSSTNIIAHAWVTLG